MDYCFVVRRAVSCCALVIALFCPLIAEAALSAPVSLQATAISPSQMNLRWVNTATNATGYSVERSLTSTGGFMAIGTTGSKGTTYQSTGLASATTYYYRVRATGPFLLTRTSPPPRRWRMIRHLRRFRQDSPPLPPVVVRSPLLGLARLTAEAQASKGTKCIAAVSSSSRCWRRLPQSRIQD
jgi:Fibronectin type III domain